jgi:hypothetical protein
MTYVTPTSADMQDLFTMWRYVNNTSGGVFTPLIVLALFVVMFVGGLVSGARASRVWTFASFFATILTIIFAVAGLMNKNYIYLLILFTALGLVWIKLQDTYD